MKRLCFLAVLIVFGSSAHAFSFSVGGHRIHLTSSSHCRSISCVSASISRIYQSRRYRDRYDDDDLAATGPSTPATAALAHPVPRVNSPPFQPAVVAPRPAAYKRAASASQTIAAPPPRPAAIASPTPLAVQPAKIALLPPPSSAAPAKAAPSAPVAAPQIPNVSNEIEDEPADTPIGDWQTAGKGSIRIAKCGHALCGYALDPSSNGNGEAVLINMKLKPDRRWTGNVYSHDSGQTYYGTMDLKSPNTLHVEACALGWFYCSGNVWNRIVGKSEGLTTSRQMPREPRS